MLPEPDDSRYEERLSVPLRWWAVATMFLASVLLAFLVALPAGVAYGCTAAMLAVTTWLFLGYGRARLSVAGGVFRAGRAQIPVGLLANPRALDIAETRAVAGPDADARAYLVLRPYLPRAVMVDVVDPDDPAPYWLVCTRHPRTLSAALTRAITEASAPPRGDRPGFPA